MNYTPKLLPIGLSDFKALIEEDYIYVDKTDHIHKLITTGKCYFLSRPRRFGKSLLLSTLKQIFLGNKELFKPFFIYSTNYEWQEHPIIHLDFSAIIAREKGALQNGIARKLREIATDYGIDIPEAFPIDGQLEALLKGLSKKNKVVILVDEYDYPMLNHITRPKLAEEHRALLHDFFAVVKANTGFIHFVFITGITQFSKTSIFSGLNNLSDLTLQDKTAQLLGYTEDEITHNFKSYLEEISHAQNIPVEEILKQLQMWYNGYQFADPKEDKNLKVYNPTSVLSYLDSKKIKNYWFATGTPTFLAHLITKQKFRVEDIDGARVNEDDATHPQDLEDIKLIPLLWQTGYLTIKSYDRQSTNYTLTYPNEEVRSSFLRFFMNYLTKIEIAFIMDFIIKLAKALKSNDIPLFLITMQTMFAKIPYTLHLPYEKYYQSIFYLLVTLIGANAQAEVFTNDGRIDATIETSSHIYIFEFKLDASAKSALTQIMKKKYYQKYLQQAKKIVLIGVKFSTKSRNIENWLVGRCDSKC